MSKLTLQKLVHHKLTINQIEAARQLLKCMAWVNTVRPIVEAYQNKILAENEFFAKYGARVVDCKLAFTLYETEYWDKYFSLERKALQDSSLVVDDLEFCPLLVAENLQREAEQQFIESFTELTTIKADTLNTQNNREKYLTLLLNVFAKYISIDLNNNHLTKGK